MVVGPGYEARFRVGWDEPGYEARLPNNEEISPKVTSGRKYGVKSNNTYICSIIAPEPSNEGTPNCQIEVRRVSTVN